MPYIPKPQKKEKKWAAPTPEERDRREIRAKAYATIRWRKLRLSYIQAHPLCEECLHKGKVVAGIDVHHKKSPFKDNKVNEFLMYDENNLETLCKDCHGKEHSPREKQPEEIIEELNTMLGDDYKPSTPTHISETEEDDSE